MAVMWPSTKKRFNPDAFLFPKPELKQHFLTKDGGNCYLFDCGPAEDFRCKFTSHSHYTSGVIRRRENAHEEELTQLKK